MGCGCVCAKAISIAVMGLALGVVDRQLRPLQLSLAPQAPAPTSGARGPAAPTGAQAPASTPASGDAHSGEGMITLAEAKALFDAGDADWIDARTLDEYNTDRIGQALHIAPDAFFGGKIPDEIGTLSRDRQIVVYCGGGACDASLLVALHLRELGFARVVVVKDGWNGWTAAGYPTANHPGGAGGGR